MDVTDINTISAFFGVILSLTLEQADYFKSAATPAVNKILIVLGVCVAWALVVWFLTIDTFPTTLIGWRNVLVTAVVTALSSQAFHQATNNYLPSLGDWLLTLTGNAPKVVTVSTTSSNSGTVLTGNSMTIANTPPDTPLTSSTTVVTEETLKNSTPTADVTAAAIGGVTDAGGLGAAQG